MFSIRGFVDYRVTQPFMAFVEEFRPGTRDALRFRRKERLRKKRLRRRPSHRVRVFSDYLQQSFPELRLGAGDVALDIGANEGLVAHLLASSGAQVVGFEPNPQVFKVAVERCAGFGNVTLVNAAIVQESGIVSLFFPPNYRDAPLFLSEWVSTSRLNESVDATHSVSVFGVALSEVLKSFDRVKFLKVDIEGGEMDLWQTLEDEFERIEFVAMEVHPNLVRVQEKFIERAQQFIRDKGLESNWRLDWP